MEIRYQIFLSSTYEDLQKERAEVMQALLELDCLPAGMELFPAASEEQWKWIQRVIDESDYYMVIIGGKYGSINANTGISYTEMEYNYATSVGKPTIAFVIDKSFHLPEDRIEIEPERRQKLEAFKQSVQRRLCKFWENTPDLGAKVSRSVTQLIKREPAIGWVRADAFNKVESEENLRLRNQILELERSLAANRTLTEDTSTEIAHGSDEYELKFVVRKIVKSTDEKGNVTTQRREPLEIVGVRTTWDAISTAIGSVLLSRAKRSDIVHHVLTAYQKSSEALSARMLTDKYGVTEDELELIITPKEIDQIKVQFMALGLVKVEFREETLGKNSIFGRPTTTTFFNRPITTEYWIPTEDGVRYFGRNLAVKR